MAVNPDVGATYGYSPEAWAAMTSSQRAAIKAGVGGIGAKAGFQAAPVSAPTLTSPPVDTTAAPVNNTTYDTTGYAAAPAAMATRDLATAPEWLAYLSALGLEESMARADVDRMRGLYQSEAARLKQDLVPQYQQQRRGIAGALETRGMARSGEYLRRLAENRAQQGRQQAGIDANLAGQVSGLESQLAQKMGSLASQRAQQEMTLRSQGYV